MNKDLAASVRARLLNVAKAQGALLFTLWYDMPHRTTRDADLLGFGPSDVESIAQTFRDIARVEVEDGIVFDPATVGVEEVRKDTGYAGARVLITGKIANTRCKTQIDIGFGDAVTPGPVHAVYPVLINDFPAPRLRTYPVYTVISEKLHAIAATFIRRGMPVPAVLPVGLTDEFATDSSRQTMWNRFLKKNEITITPLSDVVARLRAILEPALIQAATFSDASREFDCEPGELRR